MTAADLAERLDAKRNGPGWIARCPAHDDKSPSLSINEGDDGRILLKCFAGCSAEDVCRAVGLKLSDLMPPREPIQRQRRPAEILLDKGTPEELDQLAELRKIGIPGLHPGLENAITAGFLRFGNLDGFRCWIVTDSTRRNMQARRLDGGRLAVRGKTIKAKTLPGSRASWPLGCADIGNRPHVALCEGGPDALAAYQHVWGEALQGSWAVVAMMGAANRVPGDALPHFEGKHVRVFIHNDEAGARAFASWGHQLRNAGATVDGYSFEGLTKQNGKPIDDLNDLSEIDETSLQQMEALFGEVKP